MQLGFWSQKTNRNKFRENFLKNVWMCGGKVEVGRNWRWFIFNFRLYCWYYWRYCTTYHYRNLSWKMLQKENEQSWDLEGLLKVNRWWKPSQQWGIWKQLSLRQAGCRETIRRPANERFINQCSVMNMNLVKQIK